jgi:small-conductance mechanosensitive channel
VAAVPALLPAGSLPYLLFAALLVGAAALAWMLGRALLAALRRLAPGTGVGDERFLRAARRPLVVILAILLAGLGMALFRPHLPEQAVVATGRLAAGALILAAGYAVARLASTLLRQRGDRVPRMRNVADLASRLLSATIYVMAFLLVLDTYGISVTPILTGLGIAGIAVALALQDTLANFFAGLWIQSGRNLQVGHYLRLRDFDQEGFLERVGWRTTTIRQLGNNIVIVPNSKLAQSVIIDYDLPTPRMAVTIQVTAPYGLDPDRVEALLLEEAAAAARAGAPIAAEPRPHALVSGFTDGGVQYQLNLHVASFRDQFVAQDQVRRRILKRFAAEGIPIPHKPEAGLRQPADAGAAKPEAQDGGAGAKG